MDHVIWWTGAIAWGAFAAAIAWVVVLLILDAIISAWHVAKVYSFGWPESDKPLTLPFKMFWYFFARSPRYVDLVQTNARVYRPFAKELPEDEYN